jgi:hypothetical protein
MIKRHSYMRYIECGSVYTQEYIRGVLYNIYIHIMHKNVILLPGSCGKLKMQIRNTYMHITRFVELFSQKYLKFFWDYLFGKGTQRLIMRELRKL